MTDSTHPVVWLHHAGQRLGLVPSLGGSVAAWQLDRPQGPLDLWRPWDGKTQDLYQTASFAMNPPRLGEHTQELLQELGYSSEAIAALQAGGITR